MTSGFYWKHARAPINKNRSSIFKHLNSNLKNKVEVAETIKMVYIHIVHHWTSKLNNIAKALLLSEASLDSPQHHTSSTKICFNVFSLEFCFSTDIRFTANKYPFNFKKKKINQKQLKLLVVLEYI